MRANRLILALAAIAAAAAAVRLSLTRKPDLSSAAGRANPGGAAPTGGLPDPAAEASTAGEVDPAAEIPDSSYWTDGRPGIDMDRLRSLAAASYRPVVQYLTAIEAKRGGERSSLLFIRKRDLEEMAAILRDSPESLVQKFRQLGVLVSMN